MADLPCPFCGLGGGFHDSAKHSFFGVEWATEKWGPPHVLPKEGDYTPFWFTIKWPRNEDGIVVITKLEIKKKVIDEVSGGGATAQDAVQGGTPLQPS